jgi:uncharacterized protein
MLSSELLRTRIYRNGQCMIPEFVDPQERDALILSSKLIKLLEVCTSNQVSKTEMFSHVSKIESQYKDYKLVRGLLQILERRCTYLPGLKGYSSLSDIDKCQAGRQNTDPNKDLTTDTIALRREIFEESARVGFALTKGERISILEKIARKSGLELASLETLMWKDLDENQRLGRFETVSAPELLVSYNLSLLQTLLFGATEMEFYIEGGMNWKKVLRLIKRLGLMYDLRYSTRNISDPKNDHPVHVSGEIHKDLEGTNGNLTCVVQGTSSTLKPTDRYGSAIAKLIPLIVFNTKWFLKAPILKRTVTGKVKQYYFEIDNKQQSLFELTEKRKLIQPMDQLGDYAVKSMIFDSIVEEKFARKFASISTGWNIVREPDPLVLPDGRAFIPDFMFEKYGKKVYFEIVGFWTEEYLKRKISKIADLMVTGSDGYHELGTLDLLVAVNINNHLSQNANKVRIDSIFSEFIDAKKILVYRKDEIPLGPLLQYLKNIEYEMIDYFWQVHQENLTRELQILTNSGNNKDYVISLDNVACKFGIPTESVLKALKQMYSIDDNSKCTEQDFILIDSFLVSKRKVSEIDEILKKVYRLNDAMNILEDKGVPEKCVTNLISRLGYDIVWKGIDLTNATISKRYDNQIDKQSINFTNF